MREIPPYLYRKILNKATNGNGEFRKKVFEEKAPFFRIEKQDVARILRDMERWDMVFKPNQKFPYFKVKTRVLNKPARGF